MSNNGFDLNAGIEKLGDLFDSVTGDQFSDQVDSIQAKAKDLLSGLSSDQVDQAKADITDVVDKAKDLTPEQVDEAKTALNNAVEEAGNDN